MITSEPSVIKKCVIITGMSGGGKSSALDIFEDQGFYAIDNLPPAMLPELISVLETHNSARAKGVAVVVDVRGKELFNDLQSVVSEIREKIKEVSLIFVDATDDCLLKRFETTRRRHPMASGTTILRGIAAERKLLASVRSMADVVVDTSEFIVGELRNRLLSLMEVSTESTAVIFSSFGFKYGIPQDADYIFDVRFLSNPNYVDELHMLSGKDQGVREYLNGFEELELFMERAKALIEFILSVYGNTGKGQFHVAIGCTGGRHRSVAIAEMMGEHFRFKGERVIVCHRDIEKGNLP